MRYKDLKDFLGKENEEGSLTIIGTALVDTGSRMDEVILKNSKEQETQK